jgi:hypothetical protein
VDLRPTALAMPTIARLVGQNCGSCERGKDNPVGDVNRLAGQGGHRI